MAKRRAETTSGATCGCGACDENGKGRKAVAVDPDIKASNLARLKRIEGQIRGIQRMVDEDRYCPDVMAQVVAVGEALRSVGRELLRNHLKHCVTAAVKSGSGEADEMCDELADLFHKTLR